MILFITWSSVFATLPGILPDAPGIQISMSTGSYTQQFSKHLDTTPSLVHNYLSKIAVGPSQDGLGQSLLVYLP